jgi:hypothetical protein
MNIVKVTWPDAVHQENDIKEDEVTSLKPSIMMSFGLLMLDHDDRVVIVSHVAQDEGETDLRFKDSLCIPRESVLSIEVLWQTEVMLPELLKLAPESETH